MKIFTFLLNLLKASNTTGMYFPMVRDPQKKRPSALLTQMVVSFGLLVASVINLHFDPGATLGTMSAILTWALSVIFYLFKGLDKATIDLDKKSISLEDLPNSSASSSTAEQKERED